MLLPVLIAQLVQREFAAVHDFEGAVEGFGEALEQAVHFFRWFEISIGITLTPEARIIDRAAMPDAGHDVLQYAAFARVEQHIICHHAANTMARRQIGEIMQPELVMGTATQRQRHIGTIAKTILQPAQMKCAVFVWFVGQHDSKQAVAIVHDILPGEMALRLATALFAQRQQAAKARVGRAIGG